MQKLVVGVTHTTGDGDTMAGIASRYGVPLDQLYQAHLNTTRTEAVMPYTVLPAGQRIVVREPRIIAHEIARQGGVGVLVDHCARPNNQRLQHHCLTVLMNMCRTHAIKRDIAYSGVVPTLLGLVTVRPLLGYSTRRSAVTSACDCACVCVCVQSAARRVLPTLQVLLPDREFLPLDHATTFGDGITGDHAAPLACGPYDVPTLTEGQYDDASVGLACRLLTVLAITNPLAPHLKRYLISCGFVPPLSVLASVLPSHLDGSSPHSALSSPPPRQLASNRSADVKDRDGGGSGSGHAQLSGDLGGSTEHGGLPAASGDWSLRAILALANLCHHKYVAVVHVCLRWRAGDTVRSPPVPGMWPSVVCYQ